MDVVAESRTMTVEFAADDAAIVISLELDRTLAERVFADASLRGVRPSDVVANALREHYERITFTARSAPGCRRPT